MSKIFNPCKPHIKNLKALLAKSRRENDPALWLYHNDARKHMFMLEAFCRLIWKAGFGENFYSWKKMFKKLEDMSGVLDNYVSLNKDFAHGSKREMKIYLELKQEKVKDKMNRKLRKNDYYLSRLRKFESEVSGWTLNATGISKLESAMQKELEETELFFLEFKNGFHDMEEQVHELRRKLRWLSIYGQALGGMVKLEPVKTKYSWEKVFVKPRVLRSEFMKLPLAAGLPRYILLNEKAFAALSFVIAELGRIKDKGLKAHELARAFRKTGLARGAEAVQLAEKQTGAKSGEEKLLQEAHQLLHHFFVKYKIHRRLIISR